MRLHYHRDILLSPDRAMSIKVEAESTLTDRYQTTVPEPVRQALGLGKRDKIRYSIRPDGDVTLHRVADAPNDDPVIRHFLGFLARDLANHPERLQAVDAGFVQRLQSLTTDVDVDLDAALSAEDE